MNKLTSTELLSAYSSKASTKGHIQGLFAVQDAVLAAQTIPSETEDVVPTEGD